MRIQIDRSWIREFVETDRAALVRYANNPRIARNLRDRFPSPYTEADADDWFALLRQQDPPTNFAIADEHEIIGGIGLELEKDLSRRSAEIGYWVAEPFWGRGIATLAVKALTAWGFRELDLVQIHAGVFASNPASARVLEKAGYSVGATRKTVVKTGALLDELVYAIVRSE